MHNLGPPHMIDMIGATGTLKSHALFRAEMVKVAASFEFAANEGRTEYHNNPQYLKTSYDRYSRTVEDFLAAARLLRLCDEKSPAATADFRAFEDEVAQCLHSVKDCLCISDNRLSHQGQVADSNDCRKRQSQAATYFKEIAEKLRSMGVSVQ